MSKIEMALSKARGERGIVPFPTPGAGTGGTQATGTALVTDRAGHAIDTIGRMCVSESRLLSAGDLSQRGIIHTGRLEDPVVQVFRELRTKIIHQSQGQNGVILVTALNKGGGGSFVAQNLGAAFAFDAGKTVLLIDCNLKNPSVDRLIANAAVPGLTDYLENPDLDIAEIIRPVGIARYRVITAGKRREIPMEYFTSLKMRGLIDSVRQRYRERFIILDGPPMSNFADIRILSELCDYALVVARYGRATNAQIENCLNVISGKKLLGVVFNDEPRIPRIR
jgi:capsular exopolysaccharide synthesis family protein